MIIATLVAGPLRWVPIGFEKAVWLQSSPPIVYTDLGTFEYLNQSWEPVVSAVKNPYVRSVFSRTAAMRDEELILPDGSASLLLTDGGRSLLIVRRDRPTPRLLRLPTEPEPARFVRVFAGAGGNWWVQGIAVMGDAMSGVFLVRLLDGPQHVVRSSPRDGPLPAFAGALTFGSATWFIPDPDSLEADIWIRSRGAWDLLPAPFEGARLLDAMVDDEGTLWAAYSGGLLRLSGENPQLYVLGAGVESPVVLCGRHEGGQVQGRWKMDDKVLGWGVGFLEPVAGYPIYPQSCRFLTHASASRSVVADQSVRIFLTPGGSLPVAE